MMMKYLPAAAAALLSTAPAIAATPITYDVNGSVEAANFSYSLTTNGKVGALSRNDIISYAFTLTDHNHTVVLTPTNSDLRLDGNLFSATADYLTVNYDDPDTLLFVHLDGISGDYEGYTVCGGNCNGDGVTEQEIRLLHPVGEYNNVIDGSYTFPAVTSSSPGAVPEPATWAMMIGGFGLVGASMRRRKSVVVASALA